MISREGMNKINDYATKGAIIAVGIGVLAGALLSLVTLAPGFFFAALTVGLVVNCFVGAGIGAGIGLLARNENGSKPDCKPSETKQHGKHKAAKAAREECPAPEQEHHASTHFQDKVYQDKVSEEQRIEEAAQR